MKEKLSSWALPLTHIQQCKESFIASRPTYHNELHCFSTALTFVALAENTSLALPLQKAGFLAGLYHDAGHLQASDDALNISQALIIWAQASQNYSLKAKVSSLITATGHDAYLGNFEEKLLHDADLLQTIKPTLAEACLWQQRLAEEQNTSITMEDSFIYVEKRLCTKEGKAYFVFAKNALERSLLRKTK